MKYKLPYLPVLLTGLVAAGQTHAVENLTTEELVSHCIHYADDPDGADGIFCVRYVQGFIDGAVATDERVTENVAAEYDRNESFTERAIRTRVGSRLDRFGPSYYAEFCLGAPVPLAAVVEKVVGDLDDAELVERYPLARDIVYHTLREHYPCPEDDS
ncbi:MAG: Rap1a/Tai family immunity protein [Pseudomonadota bacterium]